MKVELTENEIVFISTVIQNVEVNKVPVNLKTVIEVLQKINIPLNEKDN